MKHLVIDRRLVRNNIKAIKERADGAAIYADLSANAYGLGLLEMAKLLRNEGIHAYAVGDPRDAERLRDAGFTDEKIMMLRSTADPEELEKLLELGVIITVGSYDAAVAINGIAEARKTVAEVQIKVDTGLGRYGFLPEETDKVASIFKYMQNLAVVGMFTTYADAKNKKRTRAQYELFNQMLDKLTDMGLETGLVHAVDSAALFRYDYGHMDAVRADTALSGRISGKPVPGLTPVGYIEASIEEISWYKKGHRIGGEHSLTLRKPTKIAVLSVGTYHGIGADRTAHPIFPWKKRPLNIRLGGQRVRTIGDIGLLHTLIDVTKIDCAVGDRVTIDVDPIYVKGLPVTYI
ncbi:MAG: alanine racemase [Clostridiales bacterium]|nr:alanine racemase [Clostridiales bacterium]